MTSVDDLATGVLAGDRAILGRAITLVESRRPDHQELAQELLNRLLPHTGGARRIGVTGVPGVGKSTFLESLGSRLIAEGHRLAVLAIDPSSTVSGGSLLGDKTRMEHLARDDRAFIRPSPTGGTLGGVARKTREALLLCEAAGYSVIFVETVGVGQSEAAVADLVDCLLFLILPGGGDELQGIKRGLLERVDVLAINKADGERVAEARRTLTQYRSALRLLRGAEAPPVLSVSGLEGAGLSELWQKLEDHRQHLETSGELARRRASQGQRWLWTLLEDGLLDAFRGHPGVAAELTDLERRVATGEITPTAAARRLLAKFR